MMKKLQENEYTTNKWRTCKFEIDKDYQYIKKGFIFSLCSNLVYYCIAQPIIYILVKIIYDFKIEGKENLEKTENGAISISNHILVLDCAMVGLALKKRKVYYTTQEDSFKIPVVRKLLRAVPIPKSIENKKNFIKEIDKVIQEGSIVHFYPEGSLIPYCEEIRNFKNGAFEFAVRNKVDIIPMVFIFRNPKGIRKIFKRKKDVTLKILEPIKYEEHKNMTKEEIQKNLCKN